jgi:hypothetical protein
MLGDPEARTEPRRQSDPVEFGNQVVLYVEVALHRRKGIYEPEQSGPKSRVRHRVSYEPVLEPGHVKSPAPLLSTQLGQTPRHRQYLILGVVVEAGIPTLRGLM